MVLDSNDISNMKDINIYVLKTKPKIAIGEHLISDPFCGVNEPRLSITQSEYNYFEMKNSDLFFFEGEGNDLLNIYKCFLLARTENSVWISLSVGTHRTEMIQINIGGNSNSVSKIWHNTKYKPYQSPEVPVITENTPGIVDKDSWKTFWVESELTHNGHLYVAVGKSGEASFLSANISDWSGKKWTHVGLGRNPAPVAYRGLYDGQEPVCPGEYLCIII